MSNIEDISYGAGRELKENNEKLNTTESYFVVNGDNDVVVHATDGKLLNIGILRYTHFLRNLLPVSSTILRFSFLMRSSIVEYQKNIRHNRID